MNTTKKNIWIITTVLIFLTGCGELKYTNNNSYYNDQRNTFSELDTYGQWITIEPFGDVWRPDAGYNWRPYDSGQWELTDRGWMWFSDEPFGWIVYHYGNWAYTDVAGWVWIPGYDWYPSRVRWITYNDYIGWAPLPPVGWNLPNLYDNDGNRFWMIVHARDFDNREINKYRVGINSVNNTRDWNSGREPEANYIRRESGRNIQTIGVQTDNVRGGKRDLTRIRIRGNTQDTSPSQPINNNFTPPPVGRTSPQDNTNTNNRTDTGDRNTNKNPITPNVQVPKTRGDLVEPNRINKKTVEPVKENPIERKQEPPKPVIRNDNVPKNDLRVIETPKKPLRVDDIKKQKKAEKNLKTKEVKKINSKDKKEKEKEITK